MTEREQIKMDADGLVIASYLNSEGKLRFVFRIYRDKEKDILLLESKGHISKAGAMYAMMKEVKRLKDEGAF